MKRRVLIAIYLVCSMVVATPSEAVERERLRPEECLSRAEHLSKILSDVSLVEKANPEHLAALAENLVETELQAIHGTGAPSRQVLWSALLNLRLAERILPLLPTTASSAELLETMAWILRAQAVHPAAGVPDSALDAALMNTHLAEFMRRATSQDTDLDSLMRTAAHSLISRLSLAIPGSFLHSGMTSQLENLRLAQRLLRLDQDPSFGSSLRQVAAALLHTSQSLGKPTQLQNARTMQPAEALAGLAEGVGLSNPARLERVGTHLMKLPAWLQDELGRLLTAFLSLSDASAQAYGNLRLGQALPELHLMPVEATLIADSASAGAPGATSVTIRGEGSHPRKEPDLPTPFDLSGLLSAQARFVGAIARFARAWSTRSDTVGKAPSCEIAAPLFAIDLAGGDCLYDSDIIFTLDVGGTDSYANNAGGNNVGDTKCLQQAENLPGAPAAALIDLGSATDTYPSVRSCGANGGGFLGSGFLLDEGGSESYWGEDSGVNGGGFFGSGLLVDLGGSDIYSALTSPTSSTCGGNGGGCQGLGLLWDSSGNDRYVAGRHGVNGGGATFQRFADSAPQTGGIGFLYDGGGADAFDAGGRGSNGGASGWNIGGSTSAQVRGFLLNVGGSDSYDASRDVITPSGPLPTTYGGNGGAAGGSGFLLDTEGSDLYEGIQSVNGGALLGVGFLLDGSGSDQYLGGPGAGDEESSGTANGGSCFGVGFLFDGNGDDVYRGGRCGANGATQDGLALLVDTSGDDRYLGESGGVNGGAMAFQRQAPLLSPTALLYDGSGDDLYEAGRVATNGATITSAAMGGAVGAGTAGLLYDAAGNDMYDCILGSHPLCVGNGAMGGSFLLGLGALLDQAGNDSYVGGDVGSTEGPSAHNGGGLAMLFDGQGRDEYRGRNASARNGGLAVLADYGISDDVYDGGERADVNAYATHSGRAVLLDGGGLDRFIGANGSADARGSSLLVDASGDDEYSPSPELGARPGNGGGRRGGAGILIDPEGSDTYIAGNCGTNGGALGGSDSDNFTSDCPDSENADLPAFGYLIDGLGNDNYSGGSYGSNGGAYILGSGHLIDLSGSDMYEGGGHGENGGTQGGGAGCSSIQRHLN